MSLIDANAQTAYRGAAAKGSNDLQKATNALEAHFFKQILKESGAFKGDGGASASFARDQWVEVIADSLSKSQDLGLGLDRELSGPSAGNKAAIAGSFQGQMTAERAPAIKSSFQMPMVSAIRSYAPAAIAVSDMKNLTQGSDFTSDLKGFVVQAERSRVTSAYGERKDPFTGKIRSHHGVDIGAVSGSAVHSATPGEVVFAGDRGGYGNTVVVKHADGTRTLYAHLSEIAVKKGETVALGETLGKVGSTGRSTGPHLHLEVRRGKTAVDPTAALKRYRRSVDGLNNPASLRNGGSQ